MLVQCCRGLSVQIELRILGITFPGCFKCTVGTGVSSRFMVTQRFLSPAASARSHVFHCQQLNALHRSCWYRKSPRPCPPKNRCTLWHLGARIWAGNQDRGPGTGSVSFFKDPLQDIIHFAPEVQKSGPDSSQHFLPGFWHAFATQAGAMGRQNRNHAKRFFGHARCRVSEPTGPETL